GGPIIIDFMIVPGREEGRGGMRRLQIFIHLVLGIATAIVVERIDFVAGVGTETGASLVSRFRTAAPRATFIDIVAIVKDGVEIGLFAEVTIGGEMAAFIILAAGDANPQPVDRRARRRRRAHCADRARLAARQKAVPVAAPRCEPLDLRMDGMTELGPCHRLARLYDLRET